MILLKTKGLNCTKDLSQAVNFKPVSLHKILSDRDKQGIISEQRRGATSLTRTILDEEDERREEPDCQCCLRTWLCYIENILASTIIGIFLFFACHDHALIPVEDCRPNIEVQVSIPSYFMAYTRII
jgi:hypothetical protein